MEETTKEGLKPIKEASPVKELNLFYIIDISGSMGGSKIQAVNDVMPQVMDIVDKISDENKDNAVIKASVLTFEDAAKWMFPQPVYAKDMKSSWPKLTVKGGTDYGRMCDELEKALHKDSERHRGGQLNSMVGHKAPAIILMSDGQPLDSNWEQHLEALKRNSWFNEASKIAIAIGTTGVDMDVLRKFVGGGVEAKVYTVHNVEQLKDAIKVVSSVASKIGSTTGNVGKDDIDPVLPAPITDPDNVDIDDFD